jgi:predicted alpha/beta-fold hydrolase
MPSIRRIAKAMTILHLQFFALVFTIFVYKIAANIDKEIFLIFIGNNRTDTKKVLSGDDLKELKTTQYYNNDKPSVLYIHGWQGKFERRASQGIIEAYLSRGDHNIIFVDWSRQAQRLNYMKTTIEMNEVNFFIKFKF